jgi:outer membrane protein assembly factor BamD
MKKISSVLLNLLFLVVLLASGCKTEFEKTKASTDFKKKYEAALKYYEKGEYSNCQALLDDVIPFYRSTGESENIAWHYANCSFYMKEYLTSAYAFKQFMNTFPNSKHGEDAALMAANALYKMSPQSLLDQDATTKAIDAYQSFINTYPNSLKVEEGNQRIDEMRDKLYRKDFESAELYFKIGDYQAAVHSIKSLLKKYPNARDAENARYMIVKANYLLALNSVEAKQADRYRETIAVYQILVDQHPGGKFTKDAEKYFDKAVARIRELSQ